MNALRFLNHLEKMNTSFVQTKEIAALLGITTHLAGKYLEALRKEKFIEKIERGKWAIKNSKFDPLQAAEFITSPKESYISLQTALFFHGMIEQIPAQIYSITIDRSRVVRTPIGIFSFHHCDPTFFKGYKYIKPYLKIASPEKALVDYFYFSPTKTRQFTRLPELEFPKAFSWKKVFQYCEDIQSKRTRTLVRSKINEILRKEKHL